MWMIDLMFPFGNLIKDMENYSIKSNQCFTAWAFVQPCDWQYGDANWKQGLCRSAYSGSDDSVV